MNLYKNSKNKDVITFNYNKFLCNNNKYQEKLNKNLDLSNVVQ